MRYLQKGQDNTFTIKLNTGLTPYSGTSSGWIEGEFYFTFYQNQTKFFTGLTLTDVSDKGIVFSKFELSSGITNSWSVGQYEVYIFEDSSMKVNVLTEHNYDGAVYMILKETVTDTNIYYSGSTEQIYIYQ